jgi:hypothetical protein
MFLEKRGKRDGSDALGCPAEELAAGHTADVKL